MFFLGIVTKANLLEGIIIPQYILCKNNGESSRRSDLHVVNVLSGNESHYNKLIVREMTGHNDLLDYLKIYRTRDHPHGNANYTHDESKKYVVEGALFWFTCNIYGERNGPAYYIRPVPFSEPDEKRNEIRDNAMKRLREAREKEPELKDLLLNEPQNMPYGKYVFVPLPDARWSKRHPLFKRKKRKPKEASVLNKT